MKLSINERCARFVAKWVIVFAVPFALSACAVIAVADAAVSVAATAVKTTVKVGSAAVNAVIPDGKSDDEKASENSSAPVPVE